MSSVMSGLSGLSALRTGMLAPIFLCLLISGCGSTRVVTEYETIEVEVERIVPVDERLTRPIEPMTFVAVTWLDSAILALHWRHRAESCDDRMTEIRGLMDDQR